MENSFQQNTFVFLMVIGILIMLALSLAFVILFNFSKRKILKEQMRNQQLAYDHQEELLHSTIMTQEAERKRIAQDLHDEIGSKLNVILLNSHRLKKFNDGNEEMKTISIEMNALINTTINTTRQISHDLLPPTLEDFGLVEAIKELKHNYQQTGTVQINFKFVDKKESIKNKIVELNLFRVLQELINNSLRHGKATNIDIELSLKESTIQLLYSDNGEGFDSENPKNKKGLGMKNIESRLHMINAEYNYHSSHGNGIRFEITLINSVQI